MAEIEESGQFEPDNKVHLPFVDRDYSQFSGTERNQVWRHFLPYILEPHNRNKRNRLRALQANRLIDKHAKLISARLELGKTARRLKRLKKYDEKQLEKRGGRKRLSKTPSEDYIKSALANDKRLLITVHYLVWTFIRLLENPTTKDCWPSTTKCRELLAKLRPHETDHQYPLYCDVYKTKKGIDKSWSKYKHSAHLVFGYIEATRIRNPEDRADAANLMEILGYAFYAQRALTSDEVGDKGKRALGYDEINWLPEIKGVNPLTPTPPKSRGCKIPTLSPTEISAFQKSRTVSARDL